MKSASQIPRQETISPDTAKAVVELGQLILKFSRTNRATYHEDGLTEESDTDHTVMLSVIACAFADRYAPRLDIGKVAQFSLIHDLVEVYAGDTPTLKISDEERKQKDDREFEALEKIKSEFDASFPWIAKTIEEYESLKSPEARFVKAVDKLMPAITHVLNNSKVIKENVIGLNELKQNHQNQRQDMISSYAHDQPEVLALHEILSELVYENYKHLFLSLKNESDI